MLKKVCELDADRAKKVYVYYLLSTGRLTRYVVDGYLAYDDEELKNYKPKVGRPLKEGKNDTDTKAKENN